MQNKDELTIEDKSPSSSKNDNIFVPKKSNTFWVLIKDKTADVPTYQKQFASDYLFRISLSTGKEQVIKCFFELNDNYLFCYKVALSFNCLRNPPRHSWLTWILNTRRSRIFKAQ